MIPSCKNSRLRTVVHGVVFVLLAAALFETWLLEGVVIPCRVVGVSMADGLVGAHHEIKCSDCGFTFLCSTDTPPTPRAVCPQCGYRESMPASLPDIEGQRVLIDRATYQIRLPRRWEVIAFRPMHQADQILLKRVVGLPGESLEIQNGDIYVNGCIQRKGLAEQRAMAILVHDTRFQPAQRFTWSRWRPTSAESRWEFAKGRFAHAADPADDDPDWLAYYHVVRGSDGKLHESPITDLGGPCSSQLRREEDVHVVRDLLLSARLAPLSGLGTFFVRIADGRDCFETRLQCNGERIAYRVYHNGLHISEMEGDFAAPRNPWQVETSLVDRQFLLAIDGRTCAALPFGRSTPPRSSLINPVAIACQGMAVTVEELQLYRDVYYGRPPGVRHCRGMGQPVQLADDEFYVLGDNIPESEDSRVWQTERNVNANLLQGKPLAAISHIPVSLGANLVFQVPNPADIRYIH